MARQWGLNPLFPWGNPDTSGMRNFFGDNPLCTDLPYNWSGGFTTQQGHSFPNQKYRFWSSQHGWLWTDMTQENAYPTVTFNLCQPSFIQIFMIPRSTYTGGTSGNDKDTFSIYFYTSATNFHEVAYEINESTYKPTPATRTNLVMDFSHENCVDWEQVGTYTFDQDWTAAVGPRYVEFMGMSMWSLRHQMQSNYIQLRMQFKRDVILKCDRHPYEFVVLSDEGHVFKTFTIYPYEQTTVTYNESGSCMDYRANKYDTHVSNALKISYGSFETELKLKGIFYSEFGGVPAKDEFNNPFNLDEFLSILNERKYSSNLYLRDGQTFLIHRVSVKECTITRKGSYPIYSFGATNTQKIPNSYEVSLNLCMLVF